MQELTQAKNALRRELIKKRKAFSAFSGLSSSVRDRVLSLPEYTGAKTVLVYVSVDFEVETRELIRRALADGKTVAVPRCSSGGKMSFFRVGSLVELIPGFMDIPEPPEEAPEVSCDGALCVVPGLAFSRGGHRVGYGGGYYDRFLVSHETVSVGLCFDEFLFDDVPAMEHDRRVDIIVTQSSVIRTAEAL